MNHCQELLGVSGKQIAEIMQILLETEAHYVSMLTFAIDQTQQTMLKRFVKDERESFRAYKSLYTRMTCDPLSIPPVKAALPDVPFLE